MNQCTYPGCHRPCKCKGLCAPHYRRDYYAKHRAHEIKTAVARSARQRRREPPASLIEERAPAS